jgi:hypothetical protein
MNMFAPGKAPHVSAANLVACIDTIHSPCPQPPGYTTHTIGEQVCITNNQRNAGLSFLDEEILIWAKQVLRQALISVPEHSICKIALSCGTMGLHTGIMAFPQK